VPQRARRDSTFPALRERARCASCALGATHDLERAGRAVLFFASGSSRRRGTVICPKLVASSAPMSRVLREVERVAALSSTVLLLGETGVGKGLVARTLHERSPRRQLPFVHADCAALAPSVLESELFGHERGAFTGAVARRIGRLERAGGGTLFLDEIGELDAALQGRLLRVLQDREFERVGSSEPRRFAARIVAATQRDLVGDVRAGRFRADLFYRLDVIRIAIPPLRERRDDIVPLCAALLARIAARHGAMAPQLGEPAFAALAQHAWPGNVRELENALERLIVRFAGARVGAIEVREALELRAASCADLVRETPAVGTEIARALRDANGNVAAAARSLGVSRTTLRRRIAHIGAQVRRASP
jgi:transcriptional regulator with PAS, ATPase and Fis domain